MTNRIIETAITKAAESATKETLTLVLTSLAQSQADGLMLPEAIRRLKSTICDRFGLEPVYLQGLLGEVEGGQEPSSDPFEMWLGRVADALLPRQVVGVKVEELRDWYASLWDVETAVREIKRRVTGKEVRSGQ